MFSHCVVAISALDKFRHYTDEGYMGRNFNPSSFQTLIADIEAGKFKCVITKDHFRLSRIAK